MMDTYRETKCYPNKINDQVKLDFNYIKEGDGYFPLYNRKHLF